MKITEIIQPKPISIESKDTTQDLVAQDIVSYNGGSAIGEGVRRVLRRVWGKGLKQGFRCTSGPRKGRVVANPSTCGARLQTAKGAKIRKKRLAKAGATALKRSFRIKAGGGSKRLSGIQIAKGRGTASKPLKSKIVKPKKK